MLVELAIAVADPAALADNRATWLEDLQAAVTTINNNDVAALFDGQPAASARRHRRRRIDLD